MTHADGPMKAATGSILDGNSFSSSALKILTHAILLCIMYADDLALEPTQARVGDVYPHFTN
jgi:hypothetical protein